VHAIPDQPAEELVLVSASPCVPQRVSEGRLNPYAHGLRMTAALHIA
jgi:hypothetical protein